MKMRYVRIYFVKGALRDRKGSRQYNYAITDPPVAGNTTAFIIGDGPQVLIFHPFTLSAHHVPTSCTEVAAAGDVPYDPERIIKIIQDKWQMYRELQMQAHFDVAATVLVHLGGAVPQNIERPEMSDSKKQNEKPERVGGKPPDFARFKPLKPKGRKADVAKFFSKSSPASIFEAMALFSMTRSGVLTHLHGCWKDHGLGYELRGDSAILIRPPKALLFEVVDEPVLEEEDIFG